jgi:hypothetical protein
MVDSPTGILIRHYHHAHHNLEPMEECEELGCRIHTGWFPKRDDGNPDHG